MRENNDYYRPSGSIQPCMLNKRVFPTKRKLFLQHFHPSEKKSGEEEVAHWLDRNRVKPKSHYDDIVFSGPIAVSNATSRIKLITSLVNLVTHQVPCCFV